MEPELEESEDWLYVTGEEAQSTHNPFMGEAEMDTQSVGGVSEDSEAELDVLGLAEKLLRRRARKNRGLSERLPTLPGKIAEASRKGVSPSKALGACVARLKTHIQVHQLL